MQVEPAPGDGEGEAAEVGFASFKAVQAASDVDPGVGRQVLGHASHVVRVPDGPAQAGRMLDAGADGVIVPQVGSVAQAERAGASLRYAGAGRGISPLSRGNRYGCGVRLACLAPASNHDSTVRSAEFLRDVRRELLGLLGVEFRHVEPAVAQDRGRGT